MHYSETLAAPFILKLQQKVWVSGATCKWKETTVKHWISSLELTFMFLSFEPCRGKVSTYTSLRRNSKTNKLDLIHAKWKKLFHETYLHKIPLGKHFVLFAVRVENVIWLKLSGRYNSNFTLWYHNIESMVYRWTNDHYEKPDAIIYIYKTCTFQRSLVLS